MTVICRNTRCRFCKSGFCTKQYVMLNKLGGCSLWFTRELAPSPMEIVEPEINSDPSYRGVAETEVEGALEQASPQENLEGEAEAEINSVPSEKSEDDKPGEDQ